MKDLLEINSRLDKILSNIDEIGADIRNKLSPFKNLMALVRVLREESDPVKKEKIQEFINTELHNCDISLKYLSELL